MKMAIIGCHSDQSATSMEEERKEDKDETVSDDEELIIVDKIVDCSPAVLDLLTRARTDPSVIDDVLKANKRK